MISPNLVLFRLVVQKWLRLQSTASNERILETMEKLMVHECYDSGNPNFIYSLIGGFAYGNPKGFHARNGSGYGFVADQVLYYDTKNSSVASRLCKSFEVADKLDADRKGMIFGELERVLGQDKLSKGTYEVATKIVNVLGK